MEPKIVFKVYAIEGGTFAAHGCDIPERGSYQAAGKTLREAVESALALRDFFISKIPAPPIPVPRPEFEPCESMLTATIPAGITDFEVSQTFYEPMRLDSFTVEESLPGATTILRAFVNADRLLGFGGLPSIKLRKPRSDIHWGIVGEGTTITFYLRNRATVPAEWKAVWKGLKIK